MTNPTPPTNRDVIAANLMALHARLQLVETAAREGIIAMADRDQNRAIGCLLDLEEFLPQCDALYRTINLLHRSRHRFEQNEVHS